MIGRTLAHYRIVEQLGRGGMGEVYLAEDTKLGRRVALKILPPALAADTERRARFEREARAIATLNHPNIVTLYAVEEAQGDLFLTMEHVTGDSLDKLIPPTGLPLARVFEIAVPLADALATAHDHGIVHRDLKPANVMCTDEGRVKVLDFGVAKLQETAEPDATTVAQGNLVHTSDGVILGTAAYMSPEQAEGKPLDARSDLFSFGIVLYEMVTGQRPFQGNSTLATLSAILRDPPPDIREANANVPAHLADLIENCLAKDPSRRPRSAHMVREELEKLRDETHSSPISSHAADVPETRPPGGKRGVVLAIGFALAFAIATIAIMRPALISPTQHGSTSEAERKSIAVLPFTNMSADPENEYFSDGLAETLLHELAQIRDLKVAARTSSFSFKGTNQDIMQIAQKLNVAHVLEGSVQKAGHRLRITVQLINASDGSHLLSRSFDKEDTDIFAVQDEIAQQVVSALRVKLLDHERSTLERRDTESLEAYNAFLLGLQHSHRESWESLEEALGFLELAVSLDPGYAQAWAEIARVQLERYATGAVGPEILAEAEDVLERALASDPQCFDALLYKSYALSQQGEMAAAQKALDHAASLSPNSGLLWLNRGGMALIRLQTRQAVQYFEKGVELDPLNQTSLSYLSIAYEFLGDFDAGRRTIDRIRDIDTGAPRLAFFPALLAYHVDGRADQAVPLMKQAIAMDPADHELRAFLAEMYTDLNALDQAQEILGTLTQEQEVPSVVRASEVLALQRQGDIKPAARIALALVGNDETVFRQGSRLKLIRAATPAMDTARALRMYALLFPQLLYEGPTSELFWVWPGRSGQEFAKACGDYGRLLLASARPEDAARAFQRADEVGAKLAPRGRHGSGTLHVELAALRGQPDKAMHLLQELFDTAPTAAFWWDLYCNPNLASLRDRPGFEAISRRYEARMDEQRQRLESGDLP